MSIIHTVSDDEATGDVAALYAEDREHHGYVPERTRIMAVNPEALRVFEDLTKAIASQLGVRNYRLVTLAAAGACTRTSAGSRTATWPARSWMTPRSSGSRATSTTPA